MKKNWSDIFGSEWGYIRSLGGAIIDPEEKKQFWEMVRTKKENDPRYSIYEDFPTSKDKKTLAAKYCGEVLETLRGRDVGKKRKRE